MEKLLERTLYGSRWLLAPIYLGLTLTLMIIAVKFFQEIFHIIPVILETAEQDLVLTVLSVIDLSLVASLVVMVMFAGYENFVSRINLDDDSEKLDWLGKYDAGTLKLKVAASIVAISSIHLLRIFVQVPSIDNDKLQWYVIIHMTFVISAIGMGYLEKMGHHKP